MDEHLIMNMKISKIKNINGTANFCNIHSNNEFNPVISNNVINKRLNTFDQFS